MKFIYMFALLILCTFATEIKFPKLPKVSSGGIGEGAKIFTPADLPCAYTIRFKYSIETEEDGLREKNEYKGDSEVYGRYQLMSTYSPVDSITVLRPDIQGDDDTIALASASYGMCDVEFVDKDQSISFGEYLTNPMAYDSVEKNVLWDGITCDLYHAPYDSSSSDDNNGRGTDDFYSLYFCANSENRIVGMNITTIDDEGFTQQLYTFNPYKLKARESDFVIPEEYSGCEEYEDLYKQPKHDSNCSVSSSSSSSSSSDLSSSSDSSSSGTHYFKPAKLPCAYTIHYKCAMSMKGQSANYKGIMEYFGKYQLLNTETPLEEVSVFRPDIEGDDNTVALATAAMGQCSVEFVDKDESPIDIGIYVSSPMPYDSVMKDVHWDGIKCDLYHVPSDSQSLSPFSDSSSSSSEDYSSVTFCANGDKRIVGLNITILDEDEGYIQTLYTFSKYVLKASESDFVIPKKYKGCKQYSNIYKQPKHDSSCNPSSSASTNKAFAILVFITMIIALLF